MNKLALAALVSTASSAYADSHPFEMGLRVGGYGFRREGANQKWDVCRMNGFGIFGGRKLPGPLFLEAGLDMYSSQGPTDTMDLPLDRTSGLVSTAIGARTDITSWLRGYVQLGGGVELTSVSVPYGDQRISDHKAMPEGFFGLGFDLRIMKNTYAGASFRTLLMGNFDYDPQRLDPNNGWVAAPSSSDVFDASPDVANQAQFYIRRDI
jgi:hypothetical protein